MRGWRKIVEYLGIAGLFLLPSAAFGVDVTVGERTVHVPVPSGHANLADISQQWVDVLYGTVGATELPLMVIVDESVSGADAGWTTTTAYAVVSAFRNTLGGTMGAPEFRGQTDFAINGIRDSSRLTEGQAAVFVDEVLAADDTPLKFDPASPNAIESMQFLQVSESTDTAVSLTLAYPTGDQRLLLNDLGFINVHGQMLKVAAFAVLRDAGSIAALQAFAKSIRDGILAAN